MSKMTKRMINNKFKHSIWILLFSVFTLSTMAQKKAGHILRFNPDKTFKIAQFTDVHWDDNAPNCKETEATFKMVIETEKPDLILLTGDIVTYDPAKKGWLSIAKIMEGSGIPWAVLLGNHDDETELTREAIFRLLEPLPNFIGESGPENISGVGNYVLPIVSAASGSPGALIYCLDSHAYPKDKKLGNYDWIKFDQLEWYRGKSTKYTISNGGNPLPALAYFHIPIPEIEKAYGTKSTTGIKNESNGSSDINSGLLATFIDMKDVMGVFSGHDHENNYIGKVSEIALGYGQVTGSNAYGSFDRGSRIVELREGERAFNTWIRTGKGVFYQYNYPFGFSFETEANYLPAVAASTPKQGIRYSYFEGKIKSADELSAMKPQKQGTMAGISLKPKTSADDFGIEFSGLIKIPAKGIYRFYTYSDDGSKLYIDGQEVVNNDGSHSGKREDGIIALDEGFHSFKLLYFEDCMGESLELGFSSVKIPETILPDKLLYYQE